MDDAEKGRQLLRKKLQDDPRQARLTLTHAAQLFRQIRLQQWLDACDPLWLLLAALYIWYYDQYLGKQPDQDPTIKHNVRVDLEESKETARMHWVQDGYDATIHITGIGILDGVHSAPRVLKEAIRILNSGRGWPSLASAVGESLRRVLSGTTPSFSDAQ